MGNFVFELLVGGANVQLFLKSHENGAETMDPKPLHDHMDPKSAQRLVVELLAGQLMGEIRQADQKIGWLAWNCELLTEEPSGMAGVQPISAEV